MKKILFWACFLALNALALSPAPYLPPAFFDWWDKAQHAIGFGTLTVLAVLAYPDVSKLRMGLMLVALGVLIEVLQYFSGYALAIGRMRWPMGWGFCWGWCWRGGCLDW
jgi:VanZ family protein